MNGNFSYEDMFGKTEQRDLFIALLDALEEDGGQTRRFEWRLGDWTDNITLQDVMFDYTEDITPYGVHVGYSPNVREGQFFIKGLFSTTFYADSIPEIVKEAKRQWRELAIRYEQYAEWRDKLGDANESMAENIGTEDGDDGEFERD